MNPNTTGSELPAFGDFIQLLNVKGEQMTADEAVVAFRRYQQQLAQFKQETQPAIEELDAGGGNNLNLQKLYKQVQQQLADEGITD